MEINNIFVEAPNRDTYEEYKSEINPNSLVFIKDEDKLVGNSKEYQFVTAVGLVELINGHNNTVAQVPILKNITIPSYGYYYGGEDAYLLGDWDNEESLSENGE